MLVELLAATGAIFWIIVIGIVTLEVALLWSGCVIALATLIAAFLFTDAFRGVGVFWLIPLACLYVVVGVIWSIKKWWTYVSDEFARCKARYDEVGYVNKSASGNETLEKYLSRARPQAAKNKQRIVTWMTLWPFSMAWWVLTWPREFCTWLYERISTTFDRITDRIWQADKCTGSKPK